MINIIQKIDPNHSKEVIASWMMTRGNNPSQRYYISRGPFYSMFYNERTRIPLRTLGPPFGRVITGCYPEFTREEWAVLMAAKYHLGDNGTEDNIVALLKAHDIEVNYLKSEEEKKEESKNPSKIESLIRAVIPYVGGTMALYEGKTLIALPVNGISGLCGGATISTAFGSKTFNSIKEANLNGFSKKEFITALSFILIQKAISGHGGGTFIFHDAKNKKSSELLSLDNEGPTTISRLLSECTDEFADLFYTSKDLREKNPKTGNWIDLFILKRSSFEKFKMFDQNLGAEVKKLHSQMSSATNSRFHRFEYNVLKPVEVIFTPKSGGEKIVVK